MIAPTELHHSDPFERSTLWLSQEGVFQDAPHLVIDLILDRPRQPSLGLAEPWDLLDPAAGLIAHPPRPHW